MKRTNVWIVLAILWLGAPRVEAEEDRSPAGSYVLDTEHYAASRLASMMSGRGGKALTPEESALIRASAALVRALLELKTDGTYRLELSGMGGPMPSYARHGTWTLDGAKLALTDSHPRSVAMKATWKQGTVMFGAGLLREPCRLVRESDTVTAFRALSPAERTRRIRDALPEPSVGGGFSFEGDLMFGMREAGELQFDVTADTYEGAQVWKVTEHVRMSTTTRKTTWLARDLTLLRRESVTEAEPGRDERSTEHRETVTRTTDGYRFGRSPPHSGVGEDRAPVTGRPLSGPIAAILFLRACPDVLLEYEVPVLTGREIRSQRIKVRGRAELPLRTPGRAQPPTWAASIDTKSSSGDARGTTVIYLSQKDRRPLGLTMATASIVGVSGAMVIDRHLVKKSDLYRVLVWRERKEAAVLVALATALAEWELLDEALHWPSLFEKAQRDGFKGNLGAYQEALRERLRAWHEELLPAERVGIAQSAAQVKSSQRPPEDRMRVAFDPPAQDFDCIIARFGQQWKVVELHASLWNGTRSQGDDWTDKTQPEPRYEGARLWYWKRLLFHRRESDALVAMCAMKQHAVLLDMATDETVDREMREQALYGLVGTGWEGVLLLLEAWKKSTEPTRKALYESALRTVGERRRTDSSDSAIDPLLRMLAEGPPELRKWAAEQLARFGARARRAAEALEAASREAPEGVQHAAQEAFDAVTRTEIWAQTPQHPWNLKLFQGEPQGRPLLTLHMRRDGNRFRSTKPIPAGTYTLWFDSPHRAPLIVRDVEINDGVNDLGLIKFPSESRIRIRMKSAGGDAVSIYGAWAKHLGHPEYRRHGKTKAGEVEMVISGLGAGSFDLQIRRSKRGKRVNRTVALDGTQELIIDLDAE